MFTKVKFTIIGTNENTGKKEKWDGTVDIADGDEPHGYINPNDPSKYFVSMCNDWDQCFDDTRDTVGECLSVAGDFIEKRFKKKEPEIAEISKPYICGQIKDIINSFSIVDQKMLEISNMIERNKKRTKDILGTIERSMEK